MNLSQGIQVDNKGRPIKIKLQKEKRVNSNIGAYVDPDAIIYEQDYMKFNKSARNLIK